MLIQVANHVIDTFNSGKTADGLVRLDREGAATVIPIGGLRGQLKKAPGGKIALNHAGVALIDPLAGYAATELKLWAGSGAAPAWDMAFLETLVDTVGGWYAPFELDREALKLPDPGYSEPTDATLLPDGRRVAVSIVRCSHIAIVSLKDRATRLVEMPGSGGCSVIACDRASIWVVNYDTLCKIDAETLTVKASPKLQPPFMDPQYRLMTNGFVGLPFYSERAKGWLTPRPYSGDILLVAPETLEPVARIPCGGRPYGLAEFDDGRLLIQNHPFDSVQISHLDQLRPV